MGGKSERSGARAEVDYQISWRGDPRREEEEGRRGRFWRRRHCSLFRLLRRLLRGADGRMDGCRGQWEK